MPEPHDGRVRRWVPAIIVAVLLVTTAAFLAKLGGGASDPACAGVGVQTSAVGDSPEAAMGAYVRQQGGDPSMWKLDTRFQGAASLFVPTHRPTKPDVQQLSVTEVSPRVWSTTGVC